MIPNLSVCSVSTGTAGSNLNSANVEAEDVPDRRFTTEEERVWRRDLFSMLFRVKDIDTGQTEAMAEWKKRVLGHLDVGEARIGLHQTAFSFGQSLSIIEENTNRNRELVRPLYHDWKHSFSSPEKVRILEQELKSMDFIDRLAAYFGTRNPQGQAQAA